MVNPISFGPSGINSQADFSPLAKLPEIYQQAQARQVLSTLQRRPDGSFDTTPLFASGDMNLARLGMELENKKLLEGRDARDYAFRERVQSNTEDYQKKMLAEKDKEPEAVRTLRAAGVDPTSPEGRKALFPKTDTPISATDKKTINAAEDELPNVQGTISSLKRALELNDKTFTGYSAGVRGRLGSAGIPGANLVLDKEAAEATREWESLMGGEAVTTMADTLKGATTDFELKAFTKRLADPETPPAIRKSIIQRMLTLAEKQEKIKARRIEELRSGSYYKPGQAGTTTGPAPPSVGEVRDGYRFKGGNPGDPASWVKAGGGE